MFFVKNGEAGDGCSQYDPDCRYNFTSGCDMRSSWTMPTGTYFLLKGIDICRDGITLDCAGSTLISDNSGWLGLTSSANNAVIVNCNLENYGLGIVIGANYNGNTISNNFITGGFSGIDLSGTGHSGTGHYVKNNKITVPGTAIWVDEGSTLLNNEISGSGIVIDAGNNIIESNLISGGWNGIFILRYYNYENHSIISNTITNNRDVGVYFKGKNSILRGNTISNNGEGIILSGSNNIIADNFIQENNLYDISMGSGPPPYACNNRVEGNIGSGNRPIKFMNSFSNLDGEEFSELILCNVDGSTIRNVIVDGSTSKKNNGILLFNVSNVIFESVNSRENYYGFALYNSNKNIFNNVIAEGNSESGFFLVGSRNNLFNYSRAINNGRGASLIYNNYSYPNNFSSSNNVFLNNLFSDNTETGFLIQGNCYGNGDSSNNNLSNNFIVNNSGSGISIQCNANYNFLKNNSICYNPLDINISSIRNNRGEKNKCDNPGIWNDTNTEGCSASCVPVILIHGIYASDNVWNVMKTDLKNNNFDVYGIGELIGGGGYFPTNDYIEKSSEKLQRAVQELKRKHPDAKQFDIVAHSQGGLISRYYITSNLYDEDYPARNLITLDTPHKGSGICSVPALSALMGAGQGFFDIFREENQNLADDKSCAGGQMIHSSTFLKKLEKQSENNVNLNNVKKIGVVGTGDSANRAYGTGIIDSLFGIPGMFGKIPILGDILKEIGRVMHDIPVPVADKILSTPFDVLTHETFVWGDDDGAVPAVSQKFPHPAAENYESVTTHSTVYSDNAVYNNRTTIEFVKENLKNLTSRRLPLYVDPPSGVDFKIQFDTLNGGEIKEKRFYFNPNLDLQKKKSFLIVWNDSVLDMTLVSPSGRIINSSYLGSDVYFVRNDSSRVYLIGVENAEPGEWITQIYNLGDEETNFTISSFTETKLLFDFYVNMSVLDKGNEAIIRSSLILNEQNLTNVNITAIVVTPDNSTSILQMHDDGLHDDGLHDDGLHDDLDANDGIYGIKIEQLRQQGIYTVGGLGQVDIDSKIEERYQFSWIFVNREIVENSERDFKSVQNVTRLP